MKFIRPNNPGVHPIVQSGSTDAQIAYTKRKHEERIREYRLFNATDAALKPQITKSVEETYTQASTITSLDTQRAQPEISSSIYTEPMDR